jgi:tRNA threonylcarbamoyladenosine biosynthesis protein TsaE
MFSFQSRSVEETVDAARLLGAVASPPFIVGLDGGLGAGKTQFVRGFMQGFAPEYETWVSSPTYALCNTYPSKPPVHHVDAYRLTGYDDLESVGFWEFAAEGAVLVEWASRIEELHEECYFTVHLEGEPGGTLRTLTVRAHSKEGSLLADAWMKRLKRAGRAVEQPDRKARNK